MDNQGVSWFFLVCIVLPNIVFLAYWIYNMRIEVVKMVYESKLPEWLFMGIAWQRRTTFHRRFISQQEAFDKANAVRIIKTPTAIQNQDFDNIKAIEGIPIEGDSVTPGKGDNGEKSDAVTMDELMVVTEYSHRIDKKGQHRRDRYKADGPTQGDHDEHSHKRPRSKKKFSARQWENIPSTARSMKVHPESVINTMREHDAEYSTPEEF